jgi:tetratricopeptide (TPR) repeat protein
VLLRLLALEALASVIWCQSLEKGQSLDKARTAFDSGNYAKAAPLFEQAARESADCGALFYLGLTRYRLQQLDEAVVAFQAAARCNPKSADAEIALADAYAQKGNADEALSAYSRALNLDPENRGAVRGAATIYLNKEDNEKALPLLEKLVRADPENAQAHADLAAGYAALANREGAETEFKKALKLNPASAAAETGLGNLYLKQGSDAQAILFLMKAISHEPRAFEPHFLLGSAYSQTGKYEKALTEFTSALRLGGEQPEIYYQLARVYGGLGRKQDRRRALAQFASLAKKSKDDAEGPRTAARLMAQAKSLIDSGDLKGALAQMDEARRLQPSDDKVLFRLAGVEYDLQQYAAARQHAANAIGIAPSEWLYHFLLGLIDKSLGNFQEAESSLGTALRLNPTAAPVHNALGELALAQNDTRRAVASFKRASELDSQQPAYQANLAAARAAEQVHNH